LLLRLESTIYKNLNSDAVLYLEQAAFITGEVLHVDGGAHAGRW